MSEIPKHLTDAEVATTLGITVRTLQRYRKQRRIGYVNVTARIKGTMPEQLNAYLQSQRVDALTRSTSRTRRQ